MARTKTEILYIFSHGKVAAMNKANGEIIWSVKLKDYLGQKGMAFGNILHENDKLYIGTSGYVVCLSAKDGSLLWKNELKGWGFNMVSFANAGDANAAASAAANAAAAGAVAATI